MIKRNLPSILILIAAVMVIAGAAYAQSKNAPSVAELGVKMDEAGKRACLHSGNWVVIDCSAVAAARSAKLNAWSQYVIQCQSDSYFAVGDVTITATTTDGYLPAGSWYSFITSKDTELASVAQYVSCRNVSVDTDCRILECR